MTEDTLVSTNRAVLRLLRVGTAVAALRSAAEQLRDDPVDLADGDDLAKWLDARADLLSEAAPTEVGCYLGDPSGLTFLP